MFHSLLVRSYPDFNFNDINDYLLSLCMEGNFEKVEEKHILRIEQMQLKTNLYLIFFYIINVI